MSLICPARRWVTLGVICVAAVAGFATPVAATPRLAGLVGRATNSADFYSPPVALPAGPPGSLIRSEPMPAYLLPAIPISAKAYRILYRSETATGQPNVVSGVVLVPTMPHSGPRPLVGYAIGSQGLADRCAPSTQLADGTEYETALIAEALSHGWVVALTDYPGLGTAGDHPYVVGQELGHAVLDSMRAARNLPAAGLNPDGPAAIYGYSEGGGAAGWAIQEQPTYAPDIPLKGAAVGAAPADFQKMFTFLNGGPFAFLLLYTAIGFNAAYPELDLAKYLTPTGRFAVNAMENSCLEDAIAEGLLMPKTITDYVTSNPLLQPDWSARLAQNNLGGIAPQTPVILGSARQDEAIPFEQVSTLYHQWCALGVNAHFDASPLGEHLTGAIEFAPVAMAFLADRFAGRPLARAADC